MQHVIALVSHRLSSAHWTTHWHLEPGLFALHLWILESHLTKATKTLWARQEKWAKHELKNNIKYINVCSVSTVCQTNHPHLAVPVDWVLPAQRHEPNTTVVPHVCLPLENSKFQILYTTLPKNMIPVYSAFIQKRRTHRFHTPFHTPEWAPLEKDLPPRISKDVAFPDHSSVKHHTHLKNVTHVSHYKCKPFKTILNWCATHHWTIKISDESLRRLCNLRWHFKCIRNNA